MRVGSARLAAWGLAAVLGVSLFLPSSVNQPLGKEIKLPPLRVRLGEKAPDFELLAAGSKTIRLSSLHGRNVLIDFYRGYW